MGGEQRVDSAHQFIPEDYFQELERGAFFGDGERPLELDIGCGDGRFLVEMAARNPDRDYLGLERLLGRVRKVCRQAERRGLRNVKVLRLESGYALEYLLPRASFESLHLLFPDPWPKKKHHGRRLVQASTLPAFARVLKSGGAFYFKTDDEPYFEAAVDAISASGLFGACDWPDDMFYPQTDFEAQWLGQGKAIYRARFTVKT